MSRTVTIATHDALFKQMYGKMTSLVNKKTPLASILFKNKKVDFVGDQFVAPVRFGSAVGLGYRPVGANLPVPKAAPRGKAIFEAKRAYATAEYDREAIKASRNDKGAFAKVTVDEAEATVEGFNVHMIERALFGDGSGKLGEVGSVTGAGTAASPWVIVGTTTGTNAPKHKKKFYPKGAKLDFYSSAGVFGCTCEVVSADATTLTVVSLTTGAASAPVANDLIYWEGNKDGEITGLKAIAGASAGTLYGLSQTTNPEFRGIYSSLGATALDFGDVNTFVSQMEEEGESPNLAIGGYRAVAALKNMTEDQKMYSAAEVKSSDLTIGFKGIQIMGDEGPFPLISSGMCPDDELYFVNTNYLQLVMREDFGWFDDDGTVLMRDPNKDVYSGRYGGYFELFASRPQSVGRLVNFTL